MAASADVGLAFEYSVLQILFKYHCKCDKTFIQKMKSFREHYDNQSYEVKEKFTKCAELIVQNILKGYKLIGVEHPSDRDASSGISEDLVIHTDKEPVRISLKHNNFSIKHFRPNTTCEHLGVESTTFKEIYEDICNKFYEKYADCVTFKDAKDMDEDGITNDLYIPVVNLVCSTLKKHKDSVEKYFNCIMGINSHYMCCLVRKKLYIYNFIDIPKPKTAKILSYKQYITLEFNNNVTIEMRLHTASSTITKNPSLKFDVKIKNINDVVKPEVIQL